MCITLPFISGNHTQSYVFLFIQYMVFAFVHKSIYFTQLLKIIPHTDGLFKGCWWKWWYVINWIKPLWFIFFLFLLHIFAVLRQQQVLLHCLVIAILSDYFVCVASFSQFLLFFFFSFSLLKFMLETWKFATTTTITMKINKQVVTILMNEIFFFFFFSFLYFQLFPLQPVASTRD